MRQFLLGPFREARNANKIFDSPYGVLREQLERRNVRIDTYDQGDLAKADKILFFDYDVNLHNQCTSLGIPPEKLALCVFEPSVVIPKQHDPALWNKFGTVFTWDDTRLDGKRTFKLRFPQAQSSIPNLPSFAQRRHLILINNNKYSYEPGEGYGLRRRAIRYFETREPRFDLYGHEWKTPFLAVLKSGLGPAFARATPHPYRFLIDVLEALRPYRSYRGTVEDKYITLAGYRFCICFENTTTEHGFITEKIFDCFVCGTVPIYLGAPNITDFVPAEAFIDMRTFTGFDDLLAFLNSLTEKDVARMRQTAEEYLRSADFKQWQPEALFGSIAEVLS